MSTQVTFQQLFDVLFDVCLPTSEGMALDYQAVQDYFSPEVDLYLLTLLAKAEKQGLDLVYVDRHKLLSATYKSLDVEFCKDDLEPWEGGVFTSIDLSFLLHDGHSFIYKGTAESLGLDFMLNTQTVMMEVAQEFLKGNHDWLETDIRTMNDLLNYLNGEYKPTKTLGKFRSLVQNKVNNSFVLIILYFIIMSPWWIIKLLTKPAFNYLKELVFELRQPLGYKRE